jgi:hypothetical protein
VGGPGPDERRPLKPGVEARSVTENADLKAVTWDHIERSTSVDGLYLVNYR